MRWCDGRRNLTKTKRQLDSMLKDKDRTWRDVAEFAACHCQCQSLRLKPWQDVPCHAARATRTTRTRTLSRC
jgi:hypothetical protein